MAVAAELSSWWARSGQLWRAFGAMMTHGGIDQWLNALRDPSSANPKEAGWATGPLGVALMWSQFSNSARIRDSWIDFCASNRPLASGGGYLHGAGSGAVALALMPSSRIARGLLPLFSRAMRDNIERRELSFERLQISNYDLVSGVAGDLVCIGMLERRHVAFPANWLKHWKARLVSYLSHHARRREPFMLTEEEAATDRVAQAYRRPRLASLAHGVAGVFAALFGHRSSDATRLRALLRPIVLRHARSLAPRPFRWCLGPVSTALACGLSPTSAATTDLTTDDPGLCHGKAGEWLVAARFDRDRAAPLLRDLPTLRPDQDKTLLNGLAGFVLALRASRVPDARDLLESLFLIRRSV